MPPTAPAEEEGPPIPDDIVQERLEAYYEDPAFAHVDTPAEDAMVAARRGK